MHGTSFWHFSLPISWFAHNNLYDVANSPNIDIPHGRKRPRLALKHMLGDQYKGFVYGPQGHPCVYVVPILEWPRIGTNVHWNKLYWIIERLLHVIFPLVETWPVKVTTRGHSGLHNIKGQYTIIHIWDPYMHSWLLVN